MAKNDDTPAADYGVSAGSIVPGTVISKRYRVLQEVGRGGFGVVYEVEHLTLKKRFALKVLSHSKDVEIERLRREALATSRISHPNIVAVTDFGTIEGGEVYYVMELLQGESLFDVMERKKTFSLSNALPILAVAAHALQAAHNAGVVHRDLKPSNFYVTPQEDPQSGGTRDFIKILDFGLAQLKLPADAQKLTAHGLTVGTPGYAAPEQLQGKPVDGRADIYSLGCIGFELFAGKEIFTGSAMKVALSHVEKPAPRVRERNPRARISRDMEQLIARCLEKSPDDRFASCGELLEALREIARVQLTPEGHTWAGAYELGARRRSAENWLDETEEVEWWEQISSELRVDSVRGVGSAGASVSHESGEKTRPDAFPMGVSAIEASPHSDQNRARMDARVQAQSQPGMTEDDPFEQNVTKPIILPRFHALLIDDDSDLAGELTKILREHDCGLVRVNGASALKEARHLQPQLILTSVELAGISGYALCSQIKKDPTLRAIPMVLMSKDTTDEVFALHRTLPVRAEAYLGKPIDKAALIATLKSCLAPSAPTEHDEGDEVRSFEPRDVTEQVDRISLEPARPARRSFWGLLLVVLALLVATLGIALYLVLTK